MSKMKTVVIYRSIFHGTEMYAKWLAEDLGADIKKFGLFSRPDFKNYDRVIVMSAMYAGWLPAAGFIKSKWEQLQNKEVVLIYCGAAAGKPEGADIINKQIPIEIMSKLKFLTLLGAAPFANAEKKAENIKRENLKQVVAALG